MSVFPVLSILSCVVSKRFQPQGLLWWWIKSNRLKRQDHFLAELFTICRPWQGGSHFVLRRCKAKELWEPLTLQCSAVKVTLCQCLWRHIEGSLPLFPNVNRKTIALIPQSTWMYCTSGITYFRAQRLPASHFLTTCPSVPGQDTEPQTHGASRGQSVHNNSSIYF